MMMHNGKNKQQIFFIDFFNPFHFISTKATINIYMPTKKIKSNLDKTNSEKIRLVTKKLLALIKFSLFSICKRNLSKQIIKNRRAKKDSIKKKEPFPIKNIDKTPIIINGLVLHFCDNLMMKYDVTKKMMP